MWWLCPSGRCFLSNFVLVKIWVTLHFLFFRIDIDVCFLSRSSSCTLHICACGILWVQVYKMKLLLKHCPCLLRFLFRCPFVDQHVLLSQRWKKDCVGSTNWTIVVLRNNMLLGEYAEAVFWIVTTCINLIVVHKQLRRWIITSLLMYYLPIPYWYEVCGSITCKCQLEVYWACCL